MIIWLDVFKHSNRLITYLIIIQLCMLLLSIDSKYLWVLGKIYYHLEIISFFIDKGMSQLQFVYSTWNANQTRAESCGRCHQCSLLNVWRQADFLLFVLHKRSLLVWMPIIVFALEYWYYYLFGMYMNKVMYKKLLKRILWSSSALLHSL